MSLKFRVKPYSFGLPSHIHNEVKRNDSKELLYLIDGLLVAFTAKKCKEYRDSGQHHVGELLFRQQFRNWVQSFDAKELSAARNKRGKKYDDSYRDLSLLGREDGAKATKHARSQSDYAAAADKTEEKSERRGSEGGAAFSASEAKETKDAAVTFDDPVSSGIMPFFDLSSLQYDKPISETHVPVSRGNYKGVSRDIVFGPRGGYLITGPTGCGKSTVALLYLFLKPGSRVLVVEPTQANAANIYHEFKHILPTLVERIKAPRVPAVSFVAPAVARPPFTPLMVTTTEKYLEYFTHYGKVFDVDYVVVDEFHLPMESMVKMVELVRTLQLAKKYVLVSATAVGVKVEAALPPAVTCVTGRLEVGRLPRAIENSDLDPRRWHGRGDGTFAVVATSVSMAKELYSRYKSLGLRTYLITRDTYVSEYVRAVADYSPRVCYVLEPGVEAGVTLSMAVLVSLGASTAIRYDGRVVVEDTQPLDEVSAVQRGGRGGRVVPTLYVQPRPPDVPPPSSSALYYRAQALIWLRAYNVDIGRVGADRVFTVFPRLRGVTRELARACMRDGGDPFVAVYKHSDDGKVYTECGGTGAGFMELARKELFLYYWPGGYFVAPIANLSTPANNPASFVVREYQLRAAQAMVEAIPGLESMFSFDRLVDLVIQKLDTYIDDLFDVLKSVFSGSAPTKFHLGSKPPEIRDFVRESPEVEKLFLYLTTEPAGVKYMRVIGVGEKPSAEHSFKRGEKVLNFSFPDKYMKGHSLDVEKVSADVFSLLKRVLAVEVLRNGAPDRCVDLGSYSERVPAGQTWYDSVVRRCL